MLGRDPCKQGTMGISQEKGQQCHTSGHICGIVSSLVQLEYGDKVEKEVWP